MDMRCVLALAALSASFVLPSVSMASPDGSGDSAAPYRFVGGGVAVRWPEGGIDIYWRTNRPLPRERRDEIGHPDPDAPLKVMAHASINGRGMSWGGPSWLKPRTRRCYLQQIDDARTKESEIGSRVPFYVRIRGLRHAVRGRALLVRFSQDERRPERRLGC
jgi:hypothetical protein